MPNGTVKWFNTTKGYGFIAPDEGGKDVFVHISAVERSGLTGLADNQKVSYELREGATAAKWPRTSRPSDQRHRTADASQCRGIPCRANTRTFRPPDHAGRA